MNASDVSNLSSTNIVQRSAAQNFVIVFSMLVIIFGSIGNILTMLVIAGDKTMKNTTRLLFFLLACTDEVALFLNELRIWLRVTFGYDMREVSKASCKFHTFLSHSSTHASLYMLFLLSLERFCLILFPLKIHPFKTLRSSVRIVVLVFAWIIIVNLSYLLLSSCTKPILPIPHSVRKVMITGEVSLGYFLPFVLTLVTTFILLCKAFHGRGREWSSSSDQFRTVTIMLVGVVTAQLIIGTPGIVLSIATVFKSFVIDSSEKLDIVVSLLAFTYLNNGVNFYIFIVSAAGFRRTFIEFCSKIKAKVRKRRKKVEPTVSVA